MFEIGNANRINLLILTLVSFVPQLHRLHHIKNFEGISLIYVFINLLVATEQLTLGLELCVSTESEILGHEHPSLGDWLNACQFGVVWVYHATLLFIGYRRPPIQTALKTNLFIIYLFFFIGSLGMTLLELTLRPDARGWFSLYISYHMFFISPITTILGLISMVLQAQESLSRTSLGALSLWGLGTQACVFTLVGCAWLVRFPDVGLDGIIEVPIRWFLYAGWAAVDNLIFAIVQAVLFYIAWKRRDRERSVNERTSLLHDEPEE